MNVIWHATRREAEQFERECLAKARANGQVCERWAVIIEDRVEGFGVPVKERVLKPSDIPRVRTWVAPEEGIG